MTKGKDKPKQTYTYICVFCLKQFKTAQELADHILYVHMNEDPRKKDKAKR
jgi:hypothetical protein